MNTNLLFSCIIFSLLKISKFPKAMRDSKIEELAYLIKQAEEERLPQPIVFLGAGASKTGDIPLAGEIVKDILSRYENNPTIKRIEDADKTYSKLMEYLTPFERNKLLKEYIDRAKINVTHIYLAQLLSRGYVDYVLTVNFDNLMLRALALFNEFPPTYDMAVLKDLTTTNFKEKSVLYLHGQHHGLWLLNTKEEMDKVKDFIPPILNKIANQRPWIFIGYSGEDPIFDHVLNLGRFDNGLYWVTYNDNLPCDKVRNELLDKPNTNAFIIKGYDSDSFMIKLNQALNLPQPLILDKPFTSLKTLLENIIDIDDKEHFKGVKERLEIVKNQVAKAIEQFEKGDIRHEEDLKDESEINQLKKEIIDKIIKEDFDEKEITSIEQKAFNLKNEEVNEQLANLYSDWGFSITELAGLENDESLYKQGFEKYEKATSLNPKDARTFYNWGTVMTGLAKLRNDENLYRQSSEKFERATSLDPGYTSAFYNWGTTILDLAKLKNDESLYRESFEKFEKTTSINPEHANAFYNWGTAISDLAGLKNDESLYRQSFEKFEKAASLDPEYASIFYNWGTAIWDLARLKNDESLYRQSFEKFEKAASLDPKHSNAFYNWGTAILDLAKLKNDESLYRESFEKFEKAASLDPEYASIFYNWGLAILDLARLRNDEVLFEQSIEKLNKAVELGAGSYNLACAYALTRNTENALKNLEIALEKSEITAQYVENDEDWKEFANDEDFRNLLDKYR